MCVCIKEVVLGWDFGPAIVFQMSVMVGHVPKSWVSASPTVGRRDVHWSGF